MLLIGRTEYNKKNPDSHVKIIDSIDAVDLTHSRSVLTIGNFDGVHRAHQQLIAQAGLFAANTGGPVVVLTFEPHPLSIVAPERAPARLQSKEEKIECLAQAGADIVVFAESNPALLGLTAEQFVEDVIRKRFHPTHIVEGPSFGFGRGRRGTPQLLAELAGSFGCEVLIVDPVTLQLDDREPLLVTSSLIRGLVGQGKVHRAALCLGRPFTLVGSVVEGDRRGRTLGFPTANLDIQDQLIPADGVYAGRTTIDNKTFLCAISVGSRPTFGQGARAVEAHLLDFDADLYGRKLRLEFDRLLRSQKPFDSADALADQLKRDVAVVRQGRYGEDPSSSKSSESSK